MMTYYMSTQQAFVNNVMRPAVETISSGQLLARAVDDNNIYIAVSAALSGAASVGGGGRVVS